MSEFAVRWVFVFETDYVYNLSRHLPPGWNEAVAFVDRKGKTRFEILANGDGKVIAGYAWDGVFLEILTRDRFAPRRVHYAAVRVFGGLFRRFTRWKRGYAGKRVALS